MKNIKKFLLIPLFAIVCMFARIDSFYAESVPGVTYPFSITTTSISWNGTFQFRLSAQGTFYVDCGDGGTLGSSNSTANGMISGGTINKTDTNEYTFKCTYSRSGTKTIQFGGTATAYNTSDTTPTISFNITYGDADSNAALISSISGDLSAVFPNNGTAMGAHPVFYQTFQGASNLTSIPNTLFASYTSGGAYMFYRTFYNCSGLTSIPETLFNFGGNNVSGQQEMFVNTFCNCTGLTSIPANLFQRVTSGAQGMFTNTFAYCRGLTSIPETLFNFGGNNVSGQSYMFQNTFNGCTGLTSIPANLFQRLTSAADGMFKQTFYNCTGLTGYIPASTFAGLIANGSPYSGSGNVSGMMSQTFNNTGLLATSCPSGTTQVTTGYESYWNSHVSCSGTPNPISVSYSCGTNGGTPPASTTATYAASFTPAANTCTVPNGYMFIGWLVSGTSDVKLGTFSWGYMESKTLTAQYVSAPFSITTTNIAANGTFEFKLSAKGTFYVGCGTNGTLSSDNSVANVMISGAKISKTNTTTYTFKCTYSSAGTKTIQFGGTATGYNTGSNTAAISFNITSGDYDSNVALISSISGDLSAIFPYLGSGSSKYPRFYYTFGGAINLTSIPATLFGSLTGSGTYMFQSTFRKCTGLTSIPETLFNFGGNNVSGQSTMFGGTFYGCSGLTSIPANLFQRVTSGAQYMFQYTFYNCSGLTSIPETLFNFANNVSGQIYMFGFTFQGCTSLTSIPANLFQRVTSGADSMFYGIFAGCTGLTSIPETLFNFGGNNVSGQNYMFEGTFYGCTGLTSIPANLFQRVTSSAERMFFQTFCNCTGLTGYIPASTFAGLIANGSPYASNMMNRTFYNTGSLRTSCPSGTGQVTTGYESYWDSHVACGPNITLTWDGSSTTTPTYCTLGGTFLPPTPPARTGYVFNGWKIKSVNP